MSSTPFAKETSEWRVESTFADKCVFITGASGFLGKVLVEKLLYSNPRLIKIYLLIRPLKGQCPKARLDKIIESPIFHRIKSTNAGLLEKLVPVAGDLMEPELGLSEEDRELLCKHVSIVFHCAATVKFDEPLRVSVQMNVVGTQRLVELCRGFTQLISLVHASTAYANCDLSRVEERVYDPPANPTKVIEASSWMSDSMLSAVKPQLVGKRPNTYTFTKALAESQLMEEAKDLPVIIVRPSIIGAMWQEPLPGWTDNFNGPSGLFAACGKGILTSMCGEESLNIDIIPVDTVANLMIVAGAHRAHLPIAQMPIPVVHCCSGELNPLPNRLMLDCVEQFFNAFPLDECYRVPSMHFHKSRSAFLVQYNLQHHYPAVLMDFFMRVMGKKQKFVKVVARVRKMVETLEYFTTHQWHFESQNLLQLWNGLGEEDQKVYNFDIRRIDWNAYLFDYFMGIKVYMLSEKLEDLPKARSSLARLSQWSVYANVTAFGALVGLFAWNQTRKLKWAGWLLGYASTYVLPYFTKRPPVQLKTLEEYRKTAMPTLDGKMV